MFMLDTNIASYVLRKRPQSVRERFERLMPASIAVSEIVAAELCYGAARAAPTRRVAIRSDIDDFLSRLSVLPWEGMDEYANARCYLESIGRPIGNMDLLIGAHALALGATLVTNNVSEFERIPNLRVENWV